MTPVIEKAANQAVFQLQLNTVEAVKYFIRNAGATAESAALAVKQAATFHKNS